MYIGTTSLPKLYIRNIIPDDMSIPRRRSWPYRGGSVRTSANRISPKSPLRLGPSDWSLFALLILPAALTLEPLFKGRHYSRDEDVQEVVLEGLTVGHGGALQRQRVS
jgi:hypothetical protein